MMYSIKLFTSSTYFKVNKVSISGLKNASKKIVLDVANDLKMSNLMGSVTLPGSLLDDPWIKTVTLKKRYPDSYNLILNERETIMKVSSKGKCFFYSIDGELIPSSCDDVRVFDNTKLNRDKLYQTALILESVKDIQYKQIQLYNSHIVMNIGNYNVLIPYDFDLFKKNIRYAVAAQRNYKSIDYIDLRVPGKIYIHGEKDEA
jgi:cell division protein FtsQ